MCRFTPLGSPRFVVVLGAFFAYVVQPVARVGPRVRFGRIGTLPESCERAVADAFQRPRLSAERPAFRHEAMRFAKVMDRSFVVTLDLELGCEREMCMTERLVAIARARAFDHFLGTERVWARSAVRDPVA